MPTSKPSRRGPRAIPVVLPKHGTVTVYAGARIAEALSEITHEMDLYHGVRLLQVLEAVYDQGRRDGRRDVFDALDGTMEHLRGQPELKHRNPGRPADTAAKRTAAKRTAAKRTAAKRTAAKRSRKTRASRRSS